MKTATRAIQSCCRLAGAKEFHSMCTQMSMRARARARAHTHTYTHTHTERDRDRGNQRNKSVSQKYETLIIILLSSEKIIKMVSICNSVLCCIHLFFPMVNSHLVGAVHCSLIGKVGVQK